MLTLKHLLIYHINLKINEFINFFNQINYFWGYIKIEYLSELTVLHKASSTQKKVEVNTSNIVWAHNNSPR